MDIDDLVPSWELSLQARNKSPETVVDYARAARRLRRWAQANAKPTDVDEITKQHLQDYFADILRTRAPATAVTNFRYLQQFFRWLLDEDEIDRSPMERLKAPSVPDTQVPVIPDDDLVLILKACEGRRFEERRDSAIVRTFLDTGVRLGGLVSMTVHGLDLAERTARVTLKGRHEHTVPFGAKTAAAIDRYLRVRRKHRYAELDGLWLGQQGALTRSGVRQLVGNRARTAGVGHVHPHQFRHTAANAWLASDGGETDLMTLMGWKSREMLGRYARSAAQQRAREAHRRMGLGDRL